jgi:hypothetical protein
MTRRPGAARAATGMVRSTAPCPLPAAKRPLSIRDAAY